MSQSVQINNTVYSAHVQGMMYIIIMVTDEAGSFHGI